MDAISAIRCTANPESITESDLLDAADALREAGDGDEYDMASLADALDLPTGHVAITGLVLEAVNHSGRKSNPNPRESEMTYRGITQRAAEWIGMAASVAGGYVAIDGPRVGRMSAEDLDRRFPGGEWDDPDTVANDRLSRHRSGDGYVYAVNPYYSAHDLILCVPDSAGLATEGYAIPAALIDELRPMLAEAGYVRDKQPQPKGE